MTKMAIADTGSKVVIVDKIADTITTCKPTATRPVATANVSEINIYNF